VSQQPYDELLAAEAYARTKTGWDPGFIDSRHIGPPIPWDYEALAHEALRLSRCAIDLGTGGGEVLARIAAGSHFARLIATEAWAPNARLAHEHLRKQRIPVVRCANGEGTLPFKDEAFDLVLDRHEALDPAEVDRVLGNQDAPPTAEQLNASFPELHRYFDRAVRFPDHYHNYADALRGLGYAVEIERHDFETGFPALSELVQMLVIAPWYVPDLDVKCDLEPLRRLEAELSRPGGEIVLREGRYLLRAVKPE